MRKWLIHLFFLISGSTVAQVRLGHTKWVTDSTMLQVLNDTMIYAPSYSPQATRYSIQGDTLKLIITKFEIRNNYRFDPRSEVQKSLYIKQKGDTLRVGNEILVNSHLRHQQIKNFAFLNCERASYLTNGYSTDTTGKIIEADTVFTIQGFEWKNRQLTVYSKLRSKHVEQSKAEVSDSTTETTTVKLTRLQYKTLKRKLEEVLWAMKPLYRGSYQFNVIINGNINGNEIKVSTGFIHPMLNDYFVFLESFVSNTIPKKRPASSM